METLNVKHLSQSPQAGGFYVLNIELEQAPAGLAYRYLLPEAGIEAGLLQAQDTHLQLLSHTPLDSALLEKAAVKTVEGQSGQMPENAFSETQQATLLLGSDLGIGPLLYAARRLSTAQQTSIFALLHASEAFPFVVKPAKFMASGLPLEAIGACPLLEDWKIPNRLSSDWGLPGCYEGGILALLTHWIESGQNAQPTNWRIFSFLPATINRECEKLLRDYDWINLHPFDMD